MKIEIPQLALVVLIGPSGSGKSTFARRHFKPTEVISSDYCRGLIADDENDQAVSREAFDLLHTIAAKRLALGRLVVVDATNVKPADREPLVALARQYHCLPVAIVFNLPERICQERNAQRPDRDFGPHVIRGQRGALRRGLRGLKRDGFRYIFTFDTPEEADAAVIERIPLWNDRRDEHGPFDIIGDVHGCFEELSALLTALGYAHTGPAGAWSHPQGRKLIFVGDLVDRGPKAPEVVRLVLDSVKAGRALCVPGNHDVKFMRAVWGRNVQLTHGLAESLEQFKAYEEHYHGFSRVAAEFIDDLVSHYVLDGGRLVVAHAGMREEMQGRGSGKVREFALYGETTGETDEFGLPIRYNWAAEYRGRAMVVYGHTPVPEAEWLNNTINIDTGCVFGGKLTALRYPERELVSVPARRIYAESRRPFLGREFGSRLDGVAYVPRPGSYAVIRDDAGRVAVIRSRSGCGLPGGGANAGETAEQTLRREALEETGHALVIDRELGKAVEYMQDPDLGPLIKQCTLFAARLGESVQAAGEPDHELIWLEPNAAAEAMLLRCHAWAIQLALGSDAALSVQHAPDDVLDIADLLGKRLIATRLQGNVIIDAERGAAALEVLSRFAADPRWLIYLPPTMSPCETSKAEGLLEHPREAFAHYRLEGLPRVVCEAKHMGSRAVMIICRDAAAARRRFGVVDEGIGIVYTRTGRRFFDDPEHEAALLARTRDALSEAGLWDELQTDWACLDCELMPWSAKAQVLLQDQYAAVGAAARAALSETTAALRLARANGADTTALLERMKNRALLSDAYVCAYQHYCWPVASVADLKLAPFHLLAAEGRVYVDRDHAWHMAMLSRLCAAAPEILLATPFRVVDLLDAESESAATAWWEALTSDGGEGMVVKPYDFIARGSRGLVQPAVKCRGREYLRIIYGPEYTRPEHIARLRFRALGRKRALARREFALGIEALERFVRREPLRRVHECVFGVLALESEPVDPRL